MDNNILNSKYMVKINENKIYKIVESIIDEYVNNIDDDENSVQVGGINLSVESPFENKENY